MTKTKPGILRSEICRPSERDVMKRFPMSEKIPTFAVSWPTMSISTPTVRRGATRNSARRASTRGRRHANWLQCAPRGLQGGSARLLPELRPSVRRGSTSPAPPTVRRRRSCCPPPAAIFHGFIGSPEQVRRAVGSGWYLSFGMRTFASPRSLEALRTTPHERLFFETDDDPAEIGSVYAAAAAVLGCRVSELQQATEANYRRLFTPRATTGTETCDELKKNTR